MNKFLIALLLTVFGFTFSNKVFAKSIVIDKGKNNTVDVVFILDRSGSMGGLESDTIGGFNSMLEKQKKLDGKAYITTVLFDDQYELLHDRVDISKVNNITEKEYFVRGSTALLDAIGKTIAKEKAIQDTLGKKEKADKVLFVIITDGLENASREYNSSTVKKLIETQKEKYGWEFLFLGANIDAIETANTIGISAERAVNYKSDSIGTKKNYDTLNKAVEEVRSGNELNKDWKADIEADYNERNKK
ncbi:VWA domain-containing protein [Fusobacterium simiae]|uniref:VWA domain-containing protein n=1 Tax=Fusobacterium simiae TaxID=855 RepID=A0ABT4DJG3_FUSSI|nr:vWA domain-containing protein [Fusobacterium simiae]MCY7008737.1 VWA domain-containing protein [Fusobacterium simiae]